MLFFVIRWYPRLVHLRQDLNSSRNLITAPSLWQSHHVWKLMEQFILPHAFRPFQHNNPKASHELKMN